MPPPWYENPAFIVPLWVVLLALLAVAAVIAARRFKAARAPGAKPLLEPSAAVSLQGRDIFVCHAAEDAGIANEVVGRLEQLGVRCWIAPRDVQPGLYAESLYNAIKATPVLAVLMSSSANRSQHVVRELEIADRMSKPIIPVQLENFEPTGALCYYIRAAQSYSWHQDRETVLARLAEQADRARNLPSSTI
jgi:hypothetical protein